MANAVSDALQSFSNSAMCTWMAGAGVQNAVGWVQGGAAVLPSPYTKAAAVALTALQYGCNFDPGPDVPDVQEGCQGRATPTFVQYYDPGFGAVPPGWVGPVSDKYGEVDLTSVSEILGITGQEEGMAQGEKVYYVIADYLLSDGRTVNVTSGALTYEPVTQLRMFDNGSTCIKEPDPDPPGPKPDPVEPITGYSDILNCTLTATLNGFRLNPDGTASPVITYTTDQTRKRNNGLAPRNDVVGNCNWYGDLVYTGPSSCDCPVITPLPPNPPPVPAPPGSGDCPDPCPDIQPEFLDSERYAMYAPCERDAEGNRLEWEQEIPALPGLPGIALRLKALNSQMSQALNWKTPICNENVEPEGNFRTISFRSVSTSPYGKSRLRKRFRYRAVDGLGLGELVDYWKDFEWQSGAVRVRHTGSSWGNLEVWAFTEDEGKRVIRHAAGEAGIDPDQVGRWSTRRSDSSRLGVSDTMKIDTTGGYYWITERDGSNNRPIVALSSDQ